ncbi:hypothetical protein X797_004425 [Metarhizium robertsii]|uniref:Uncharacterized protein n=1 Tax=Metarhizium robertsii TaxID=568076 RepID=A0A0A1UY54_9HYPO|nr:hypothetical protein X797_004425 [Metarhizium robertsii]
MNYEQHTNKQMSNTISYTTRSQTNDKAATSYYNTPKTTTTSRIEIPVLNQISSSSCEHPDSGIKARFHHQLSRIPGKALKIRRESRNTSFPPVKAYT